ncbi:hybrid sensor histidine kinase/response regulator [Maricaulis parjimensis]|uniref:hybrid sensor histidine kinase/response regulator n=1 Tax=Maricaulis parjimensis TaxID=144023 RepID=UPI00193A209A|nr:hybrid sensor histidine kinase/response regulator [Maricaulis parjimensis]
MTTDTAQDQGSLNRRGFASADLALVRLSQAQLLRQRTTQSCVIIQVVIIYLTALMALSGDLGFALLWFGATSIMVAVVFIYPRLTVPDGVNADNLNAYLTGHIVISGLTGLVWSLLAIAYLDTSSVLNLFITINMVFSISVGGMMPSSEYRPSFISLATATLVPFSAYWLLEVEGGLRLIGLGLLIYYGFGLLVSARAEVQTQESLAAERNRRLSDQLREQADKLAQVSAEKTRFLAAASHDMSQPLQAQGFLIGALRSQLDQPEQVDLLDRIEACWRSQQSLLQGLVETARIDSGGIVVKPAVFDIGETLKRLAAEASKTASSAGITVTIDASPTAVRSDPLLVGRILRNLLSNALKFTPRGGAIRLTVKPHADNAVKVEITDTGPGIPLAAQEQIFDEYVQLDEHAGDTRGLGLGLSIVRQLADRLGLEILFNSAPGEGTSAGIILPTETSEHLPNLAESGTEAFAGSPFIVLVEDDKAVRESLSILLTGWSCRVIAAESGSEALEALSWAPDTPDILLIDKSLKHGEDGLTVIETLRGEVAETVPAILVSGDIDRFQGLPEMESVALLAKPADPFQLHSIMQDLMAAASADQA